MFDPTTFQMAVTSLNAVSDIATRLIQTRSDEESRSQIGALLAQVVTANQCTLNAQSDQFALAERVRILEMELQSVQNFRETMKNYKFRKLGETAFAYVYAPPTETTDPVHWLCCACCDRSRKSIFQYQGPSIGRRAGLAVWSCPSFKAEILVHGGLRP